MGEACGATPLATLLECSDSPPKMRVRSQHDLVALPYSFSGIPTGLPLGVMISHHNLVANTAQLSIVEPIARNEVVLAVPAPSQSFGLLFSMNLALRAGRLSQSHLTWTSR